MSLASFLLQQANGAVNEMAGVFNGEVVVPAPAPATKPKAAKATAVPKAAKRAKATDGTEEEAAAEPAAALAPESEVADAAAEPAEGAEAQAQEQAATGEGVQEEGHKGANRDLYENTVFVGNVPVGTKAPAMRRLFECGPPAPDGTQGPKKREVVSVRFRSFGVSDPKLPRKVALAKGKLHEKRDTMNAYVVLASHGDCEAAVAEVNGLLWNGKHLRADFAGSGGKLDHRRSVFVGGLPYEVREEAIREHFEDCGDVDGVRVVRDQNAGSSLGYAFVEFTSRDAVTMAILKAGSRIQNRIIRVTRCLKDPSAVRSRRGGHRGAGSASGRGRGGKQGKGREESESASGRGRGRGAGAAGRGGRGGPGGRGGRGGRGGSSSNGNRGGRGGFSSNGGRGGRGGKRAFPSNDGGRPAKRQRS